MDESHLNDGAAPPRSAVATLMLGGVGLLGAGTRPIGAAVGLGRRTVWAVAGPVWRSAPVGPVRRAAEARIAGLVAEGVATERQWRAEMVGALAGPVVDTVTRTVVEHAVAERVVSRLLEAGTLERIAGQVTDSPLPVKMVDDVLAERVTEPIVAHALASPALERVVVQVMESRLVDDLTDRILASEELQRVIRHLAQSRDLREAITESGAGLADEFAGAVRSRAVVADDRAERAARRLLRRKPIIRTGPPEPPAPSGATPG